MEPQERDLITTLLSRLQNAASAGQPKDPEADALIRQAVTQMPDAPYYLVQTVLIQDLSLHTAQNRIADLERQLAAQNSAPQQHTSFLGGLLGGGNRPAAPVAPAAGPWTRGPQTAPPQYAPPQAGYAQPGYAQPAYAQPGYAPGGGMFGGGSGFLRSAAATAAGVAGGALLFEGISSLFGHHYASGLGGFGGFGGGMPGGLGETVINNYGGDSGGFSGGDSGGGYAGGDSGGGYAGGDSGGGYAGGDSGGGYAGGDTGGGYAGGDTGGGYAGGDTGGGYDGGGGGYDSGGGGYDSGGGGDFGGGGDGGGSSSC